MSLRIPTDNEMQFLEFMIATAKLKLPTDWKTVFKVAPMDDGNMGSLLLFPTGENVHGRDFGTMAAEYVFKDKDGAEVIASLNLDQNGQLFELDVWKVTFDPLVEFPKKLNEPRKSDFEK